MKFYLLASLFTSFHPLLALKLQDREALRRYSFEGLSNKTHDDAMNAQDAGLNPSLSMLGMLDEWKSEDAVQDAQDAANARKNVLWLHLHNFGGTFVCTEAAQQGERTPPANCDWEACSQQTDLVSCEKKAKSGRYTFSMLERNLQPTDLCNEAIRGTMLRDPISGIRSTIAANGFELEKVMQIIMTQNVNATTPHGPSCLPEWDHYQHFDNFATRSLSGAYTVPPKEVTKEHLAVAKQRLADMDVVLVLEELKDQWSQLSDHFGWKVSLVDPSHHVHSGPLKHGDAVLLETTEETFLRDLNVHDYELYAYAKQLAQEKSAASATRLQLSAETAAGLA